MGAAVAVGVFGLVGVHRTEGRADAAASGGRAALDWPAVTQVPFGELPVLLMTPEEPATTTTTLPPETTTTTAPPPETTTTTAPPPPPPPAPAAKPAAPAVPTSGPEAQARVEAIADSSGWNWRAAGVRFNLAFHPTGHSWGVYERDTGIVWIGPTAFADADRLRYVVLHELAHGWQYRQNRFADFITDYAHWGFTTIGPALEAGADCVAAVWGATQDHYWSCPPDARALATRRLGGDWR
jgi:hypothetical protein